jgi:hypothetical protein
VVALLVFFEAPTVVAAVEVLLLPMVAVREWWSLRG